MPVTLCLDVGTTLVKAVVFDAHGEAVSTAEAPSEVLTPGPGCSEQDMDQVWEAAARVIAEAAGPAPVELVSVTAQGDGAWCVDREARPSRAAILWNDARAGAVVADWTARDVLTEAFRINGSLSNLGLPNAILAHLREHEPEVLERTAAVLTCGSWIFAQLTGTVGLHPSDASAPWLDIATRRPDPALLELYGLAGLAELVPPVLGPDRQVQPLRPEVASRLGLAVATPVVLAPYDVVAMATGTGTVAPGQAYTVLGTTLCTGTVLTDVDTSGPPSGLTLDSGGPTYLRAFPTLAGTGVVDWAVALLGLPDAAALVELAAAAPPGAAGLSLWPYLSPAGERAPFLDPAASGVLAGLRFHHDRAHLARAVLEGLGHVIRDCLEATGVAATELRLCGGGARSDQWTQLLADLTGVPTVRTTDTQVGAKGAMVHALVTVGAAPSVEDAVGDLVRVRDRHPPDPAHRALYDARHAEFLERREDFRRHWAGTR